MIEMEINEYAKDENIDIERIEDLKKKRKKVGKTMNKIVEKEKEKEIEVEKYIGSFDAGKFGGKLIVKNIKSDEPKKVYVRTLIDNLETGDSDEATGDSYKIEYEGKVCIVGESGLTKSNGSSKMSLIHKLCIYAGLSKVLKPNVKSEIYGYLACPISMLKDKKLKQEYKDFISNNNEPVEIKINGETYLFTIKELIIKAEGSGILATEPKLFENKKVILVDIGGVNLTVSIYNDFACKVEDRKITELGTEYLISLIQNEMSKYLQGDTLTSNEAEKMLKDGFLKKAGKKDEKSIEYLNEAKKIFLNKVLYAIESWGMKIDYVDNVVFVGGTVDHLKEQISESETLEHSTVIEDGCWATVEGLYALAYKKFIDLQ